MIGKRTALVLLAFGTAGCEPDLVDITVPFEPVYNETPLSCGAESGPGRLTDLRFYVSDVRLFDSEREVELQLVADRRWQAPYVALIDLEDGSGACRNGTPGTNRSLKGRIPDGDYRGIRFVLGVPFAPNHADPLTAIPPLDDSAMHWHWRSGYKFLRAGVETDTRHHWLHLGSAGCEGRIQSITHCRFPNRVTVTLEDYEPGDALAVDLATLYAAFADVEDPNASCSSGPAEASCPGPFAMLGIDHASGDRDVGQRLVRLAR